MRRRRCSSVPRPTASRHMRLSIPGGGNSEDHGLGRESLASIILPDVLSTTMASVSDNASTDRPDRAHALPSSALHRSGGVHWQRGAGRARSALNLGEPGQKMTCTDYRRIDHCGSADATTTTTAPLALPRRRHRPPRQPDEETTGSVDGTR